MWSPACTETGGPLCGRRDQDQGTYWMSLHCTDTEMCGSEREGSTGRDLIGVVDFVRTGDGQDRLGRWILWGHEV